MAKKSDALGSRRQFLKNGATLAAGSALLSGFSTGQPKSDVPPFELDEVTVSALQQDLSSGKYTSHSLVQIYLERIHAVDQHGPTLRAVLEQNPEALQIADQLDAERHNKGLRSALHGIPVLIKDNIATADRMQTTAGSLALIGSVPPQDSAVAARLRAAGAVILGKTNLSEWANFRSTHSTSGWSGRGGLVLNPYALDRNCSGSSSGSGAAVAANLCAIAVGSETDGSIVSPSSCCCLAGIKPTVGLIGRSGIIPISHTQDSAGPMARTVADAAALLSVLVGPDPADPATVAAQGKVERDYTRFLDAGGLKRARIGVVRKYTGYDRETDRAFSEALEAMKHSGAEIIDPVDVASLGRVDDPENPLTAAEQQVLLFEFKDDLNRYLGWLAKTPVRTMKEVIAFNNSHSMQEMPYFGQELMLQAEGKGPLTSPEYLKALADCGRLARQEGIDAVMDQHKLDALVAPTNGPAWMNDLVNGDHITGGSSTLAAVAGYPNINVPMGWSFGLPLGISFFGRAWSEPTLIKIAYAFEQATKVRTLPRFLPTADLRAGK